MESLPLNHSCTRRSGWDGILVKTMADPLSKTPTHFLELLSMFSCIDLFKTLPNKVSHWMQWSDLLTCGNITHSDYWCWVWDPFEWTLHETPWRWHRPLPLVIQSFLCCLLDLATTMGTVSPHSAPTAFECNVDTTQHHPIHCLYSPIESPTGLKPWDTTLNLTEGLLLTVEDIPLKCHLLFPMLYNMRHMEALGWMCSHSPSMHSFLHGWAGCWIRNCASDPTNSPLLWATLKTRVLGVTVTSAPQIVYDIASHMASLHHFDFLERGFLIYKMNMTVSLSQEGFYEHQVKWSILSVYTVPST